MARQPANAPSTGLRPISLWQLVVEVKQWVP